MKRRLSDINIITPGLFKDTTRMSAQSLKMKMSMMAGELENFNQAIAQQFEFQGQKKTQVEKDASTTMSVNIETFEQSRDDLGSRQGPSFKQNMKEIKASAFSKQYLERLTRNQHRHGFQRPFTWQQISSWVYYAFNQLHQFYLILPLLQDLHRSDPLKDNKEVVIILLILFNLGVFFLALYCSWRDPSDDVVRMERYCKLTNQVFPRDDFDRFCQWCDCHVQDRSKHCGRCNRCT